MGGVEWGAIEWGAVEWEWLAAKLLLLTTALAGLGVLVFRLATYLTFRPQPLVGPAKRPAWQGWLARSPTHLQQHLVATLSPSFKPLSQVFEYLTPQKWVVHAVHTLRPQLDTLIDEAIETHNSVLWQNMPITLKNRFYERAHRQIPAVIDDIIEEIGDQSDALIDIDHLFDIANQHSPLLTARLMEQAATPWLETAEWRFFLVLLTGLLPVIALWLYTADVWALAGGFFGVFYLGLWLRERSIWSSPSPRSGQASGTPSPVSGRQRDCRNALSIGVAHLLATEVFTPRHWMSAVIDGPKSRQTFMIAKKHVSRLVENLSVRTFAQLTIGASGYVELKTVLSTTVLNALRTPFEDERFNHSRAARVASLIESKLAMAAPNEIRHWLAPVLNTQRIIALITAAPLATLSAWIAHYLFTL